MAARGSGPSWDAQGPHLGTADGQAAIRRCRDSGESPAGLQSSWALSLLPQKPQSRGVKPCRAWGSSAAALTCPSALRVPSGRAGVRRPVQLVRGRPQRLTGGFPGLVYCGRGQLRLRGSSLSSPLSPARGTGHLMKTALLRNARRRSAGRGWAGRLRAAMCCRGWSWAKAGPSTGPGLCRL